MADRQEVVRISKDFIFPDGVDLRLRDEAETEALVTYAGYCGERKNLTACRLLNRALFMITNGPIWGRSLFVGLDTEMYPAADIFSIFEEISRADETVFRNHVLATAWRGVLRRQYDATLYRQMVADLAGEGALECFERRFPVGVLLPGMDGDYQSVAGRSWWDVDGEVLLSSIGRINQYRARLTLMVSKGENSPSLVLLLTEAGEEARKLESIAKARMMLE